jgi:hypothetical protein
MSKNIVSKMMSEKVLNILLKTKCQKECRNGVNINVKNLNVKMVSKEMLNILVSKIYRKKSQNQHPVLVVLPASGVMKDI